ncbi:multiple C2 and transmembrane domain-containing protein 1-like isoform X2 [Scyliorhinus canicula]|uniref:multiple C2 and transmembrane domain-containing protein 1-like isoform X2 n=1 Tax=Scyliorhinus canicula TaxID=7830 RepID=UPI0018F35345|nr:multiple C2 and transmembrane domain-containing protein 1-like isoform X2 [Scyliorhinus canicula]
MEELPASDTCNKQESQSIQTRFRKHFQKNRPFLGSKLTSDQKGESKKETAGKVHLKSRRRQVLDRVFSSSQPNLCCSVPSDSPGASGQRDLRAGVKLLNPLSPQSKQVTPQRQKAILASVWSAVTHHKSSSLGTSDCLKIPKPIMEPESRSPTEAAPRDDLTSHLRSSLTVEDSSCSEHLKSQVIGSSNTDLPSANTGMYQLNILLKGGQNLAIRDRGGTSDPYVKFKIAGKEVYRSKTIQKNLNPVWNEETSLLIQNVAEPLYIKVFDYDFALQDDFMGSAYLDLTNLELNRSTEVTLNLKDSSCPLQILGCLFMTVTLVCREIDPRETVQNARLLEAHKSDLLWRGVVSIILIEGYDLKPMDPNGLSDPYVKFKMGCQKYKSKAILKTLNPQWREQFDFLLAEEKDDIIDITVWDKDSLKKDDFIGRCQIDLSGLCKEHTHKLDIALSEGKGHIVLLVTLTASSPVSISELSFSTLDDEKERSKVMSRYSLLKSLQSLRDIGFIQIKILRAEGLMVADVTGSSDPFCVIELNNDRLQTHTVHRSLSPEWNKVFTFNITDIHSVLEVSVFDEDRDRSADFLGKVAIPLLNIQNGEQKAYVLKNKNLTGATKGVIYLEMDVIYNVIRAGIRTITPKEQKYIEEEQKISKELLQKNFYRVRRCIMVLVNTGRFINSCFEWESPQRSLTAFLIYLIVVWNFEIYVIPLMPLFLLIYNYCLIRSGKDNRISSMQELEESLLAYEEDEEDKTDKENERKSLLDKLTALQEVGVAVQNGLDEVASFYERVKNTFNWTVNFLSLMMVFVLTALTIILYFIPLRYILLVWGIHKFTKKLRNPLLIDNNEVLDFLSRVHSDMQLVHFHELNQESSQGLTIFKKKMIPG